MVAAQVGEEEQSLWTDGIRAVELVYRAMISHYEQGFFREETAPRGSENTKDPLIAFFSAIDWAEPFIVAVFSFHVMMTMLIIILHLKKTCNNAQLLLWMACRTFFLSKYATG